MISFYYLLNLKYNKFYIMYIILFIALILLIVASNIEVFDEYNTYGISLDNNLLIDVPINNSDSVNKGNYLMINNLKYNYKIINISQVQISNMINYQTFELKIDKKFKNNELVKVTFYYKKEKMIKKIIRIIF